MFFRPKWNYDGSSTGQAPGEDSEVILYPQSIYPDPFRAGDNIMVLCDCYTPQGEAIKTNTRKECNEIMEKVRACYYARVWAGVFCLDSLPDGPVRPKHGNYYFPGDRCCRHTL